VSESPDPRRERVRELGTEGVRRGDSKEPIDALRDTGGDSQETTPNSSGSLEDTVERVLEGMMSSAKVETEVRDGIESVSCEEVLEMSADTTLPSATVRRGVTGRNVGAVGSYLEYTFFPPGVGTRGVERAEERDDAPDRGIPFS
jgi:hypothetical protein